MALILIGQGLKVSGFVSLSLQKNRNWITKDLGDSYRILCLGDSMTADSGDGASWPSQLRIILNEKSPEKKFKVINEGIGGENINVILSELKNNLDKYNPNVVIILRGGGS